MKTIHDYSIETLDGNMLNLSDFKGKKMIIVNTASECGLTPQYEHLQDLYEKHSGKLVIIGFPTNDFAGQEPGTNEDIGHFCKMNYGVTFPMSSKITVKGDGMHEIYQYLTQKSQNGLQDSDVEWNFQKYLIDENGRLVKVVKPQVLPTDPEIVEWIEKK